MMTDCNGTIGMINKKPRQTIAKIESHKFHTKPRVPLQANNVQFEALFDSGAAKSIMSKKLFKLIDPRHTTLSPEVAVVFDVQDNPIETLGTATIDIKHGDDILNQEFIVTADTPESCILGIDAITKHEFNLNGRSKTVFRLGKPERERNKAFISLIRKTKINPKTSQTIKIFTEHLERVEENDSEDRNKINTIKLGSRETCNKPWENKEIEEVMKTEEKSKEIKEYKKTEESETDKCRERVVNDREEVTVKVDTKQVKEERRKILEAKKAQEEKINEK